MTVADWVKRAATEIFVKFSSATDMGPVDPSEEIFIQEIVQRHCPFKPDTAYEESGVARDLLHAFQRSEGCWCDRQPGMFINSHTAFCIATQAFMRGQLQARQPPLLQCIDCKNTESPAGAMARAFNHGRCVHCGGYFKVIRA